MKIKSIIAGTAIAGAVLVGGIACSDGPKGERSGIAERSMEFSIAMADNNHIPVCREILNSYRFQIDGINKTALRSGFGAYKTAERFRILEHHTNAARDRGCMK